MDNSPMLSTPVPETILCDGHFRTSDATAFATCKSLHLNLRPWATKVSSSYLLVEDKQGALRLDPSKLGRHLHHKRRRERKEHAEFRLDTTTKFLLFSP